MPIGFDDVYWEQNGNGDLAPRATPLALNYPALTAVLAPTVYGYANQYQGTYFSSYGMAAVVYAFDERDGKNITFRVSSSPQANSVNEIYVAHFLQSGLQQTGPQGWAKVGQVTGNGDVKVPLDKHTEYQVKLITSTGGALGVYVGNTVWITDFAARRRLLVRDRTARSALRVAQRMGRRVWYKNPGYNHIEVWATCEGGFESLGLLGGETSATRFTLWVPRQTGFPAPAGFMTGATAWVEGTPYAARVSYDAELPFFAPQFKIECERYDITVELDGINAPPVP